MELTRRDSTMPLSNACVRMVEQVSSVHDVGLLLQRMDIATCAAAERHTKVNCVTVAMGDVVVEHSPRVGELLTLTAERFPSRTENRRYLIHQLELLKRAASEADDEFDAAWRRLKEGE